MFRKYFVLLEICIFSGAFLATYFGVAGFRVWTIKRGVLDHPNERSSHVTPTPRGGGLVLALVVLVAYSAGGYFIGYQLSAGFLIGAILVVAVSWLDDVFSVSFAWRLIVHSIAAVTVVYSCGSIDTISSPFGGEAIQLGWFGPIITFCWILWLINAYNFMDGIDGIAGVQAITASIGWLVIGLRMELPAIYVLAGTLSFAAFGFLLHNWPPARIFMGDAGSAFLGFVLAALPLMAQQNSPNSPSPWLLIAIALVWLFVFDSIVTFLRRVARRERVWQAHREHLYQRLVRSGYSHRTVTVFYGIISLIISALSVQLFFSENRFTGKWILGLLAAGAACVVGLCLKRKCLSGEIV